MSTIIRRAAAQDKDFVIKAIVEAEKSGTDIISYCSMFSITEAELRKVLAEILDEEVGGQELYLPGFLIAEVDGKQAAAMSAWIEKEGGMASSMIKSNLFMYFMDRDKLMKAMPAMGVVNEVSIAREDHALQIECVYTDPAYRGQGLSTMLIDEHMAQKKKAGFLVTKVQIQLMENNKGAMRAYEKAGFEIRDRKKTDNPAISRLLSGNTKILMERTIN